MVSILSIIWSQGARGNVVGIDAQNFNPTTSGLDFVTVQSSETLEQGVINYGLFLNYSTNTLPYFDDTEQKFERITDTTLGSDLNVGIGLFPRVDIGFSLPGLLMQNVRADGYRGQFQRTGLTELRFNTKFRLWGGRDGGIAVVGSTNINQVQNNPFTGSRAGPTANVEMVGDTTFHKFALGLNVGYRLRNPGRKLAEDSPIVPVGDQWIASGAMSDLLTSLDSKLIFEIFGSAPAQKDTENSDRLASSAEALLGIKHDFTTNLAGHMGTGTELMHGRSSPDLRVYLGLNYVMGPKFGERTIATQRKPSPPPITKSNSAFDQPPKSREKIVIHDVLFEFNSDNLLVGSGDSTIQKLVDHINKPPQYNKLIIEGHTDSVGTDAYNLNLSQRRAQTIKRILIEKYGASPSKVIAIGRGEKAPIADNGNYQGRQLNRRVEFTIFRPNS